MNIIKAYSRGFKNSLRRPKMIFLIYAICLLLGLSLALPFFFSFQSAGGNSMISNSLDYTTFTELMNFHSWNLESVFHQGVFTVLVYWLLMIFFVGGIIRSFNREDYSVSTFFSGAGVNFLGFLVCDLLMIAAQIVMFLVLFGLTSFLLGFFDNTVSEKPLIWAYIIAGFIYVVVVVLLLMISDYAKFYMEMAETHRVFKAIGKAVKYVFNNFVKTYFLYALLLVVPLLTLVLYKLTFDKIGTAATWGLIAMFFIQQFFIILRIWFRVWSLSSQFEMYADDYVKISVFDVDLTEKSTEITETTETKTIEISKAAEADKIVVEVTETTTENTETPEDEKEPEYDNLIVQNVVNTENTEIAGEEKTEEEKEPETQTKTVTTTTTTTETYVLNEEGDTYTQIVEEEKNEEKEPEYDNLIVKNDLTTENTENTESTENIENIENTESTESTETVIVESEPEPEEEQSDEIDENLMEQFYADGEEQHQTEEQSETQIVTTTTTTTTTTVTTETTETMLETEEEELPGYNPDEQDNYAETDNSGDEPDDFSIDTAMGANISLEEEEEEIVTTVTEEKDPKIIKMNDFTEVVSESEPEGEPSYEKHSDGEFAEFVPEDDGEKAMG